MTRPTPAGGDITVRHVEPSDHDALHTLLTSPHVLAGTMMLPYRSVESVRRRMADERGAHRLVAEIDGAVAGFCELLTTPDAPRHAHVGELNLVATHPDWRGRGVGEALVAAGVELADRWLRLERLGLVVFTDNAHAVALYERHGFAVEGTMPRYGIGPDGWMDAHVMGRLRSTGA